MEAAAFVISLPKAKQRLVLDIATRIAERPFSISDHQTSDLVGHCIENVIVGEFHFSFWLDHAVKEVRIVDISRL